MVLRISTIAGIVGGVLGCLLTWLLLGETPPTRDFVPLSVSNLWALLNLPVFIFALTVDFPENEVLLSLITFIYWFIVVFVPTIFIGAVVGAIRDNRPN